MEQKYCSLSVIEHSTAQHNHVVEVYRVPWNHACFHGRFLPGIDAIVYGPGSRRGEKRNGHLRLGKRLIC